ncbi:hypothetical protein BASA50_004996 [Batrachochytrium salamandrivorans]|uniref:Transmembrane protein 135 N-terminal domain-containing protein n=1 Tax=Batrachochytrium salamandrivorans TaxID=1357716 RepID=A0ABQ8FH43_9FUNG|nr:hypothetical protein BASA62_004420 [Batrachochytrium salamandrivorans]KAH6579577.1 hypothetical protein BASA60_003233 [Batrachochytrium salamandrivorans]KAH6591836.1 hypothetical protein BASA61_004790 [Batrachochytrium salamandrivorans]KAH6596665.1 hypothetical protein BASA50_004996 [Batrachochytrium salamandrivorans]KAH9270462.1 hypothetical protein BASA83_007462 [Batrachochytrium salamandrivorans]
MTPIGSSLGLWENFVESIAQVLSQALTDRETEQLLSSFTTLQQRLRQLSVDNLRRLETESRRKSATCKHHGTCRINTGRAFVRSFVITYCLKYALGFFPALITGKAFSKPRILLRIGGRDTISFSLFMSVFISSYKGFLCAFRVLCGNNDTMNAFMAGTLAGLSILLDKNKSRRIMIALYLSTRTTHFISRWIWRTYVSRWSDKLGYSNPNALEQSGHDAGRYRQSVHPNQNHVEMLVSSPEISDSSIVLVDKKMQGNLRVSTHRDPQWTESALGQVPGKLVHSPNSDHGEDVNHTTRALADRDGYVNVSPPSDDLTIASRYRGFALVPRGPSKHHNTKSKFTTKVSPEDLILSDVDDHHHTHHPLRKWIRQASAILVMMFSSSQILNAYVTEPDTLANSYFSFLLTHGGIRSLQPTRAREYMAVFGETVRQCGRMQTTKFLSDPTGSSFADAIPAGVSSAKLEIFKEFITQKPHEFIMCAFQHPTYESCWQSVIWSIKGEWFRAMSLYAPLTLIMTLIFRGRNVLKHPTRAMFYFVVSVLRSSLFLTCYVTAAWTTPCWFRQMAGYDRPWMYYVNGMIAGSMVLIEVPGRRLELALYCLPRALESLYNSLVKRGYARHLPHGEALYFCLSTGVLMTLYQSDPGSIHEGYRKVMFRFFGVN